ncbi:MAG: ATP-binding protein [Chlamydiia bacterium]|nr:ATP-binding protein [Chlamydiia bacterium]
MDPINNPYSPGAGAPPPELVGRDPILKQAEILLGRIKARRPEKSLLLTGLRGVGKTVLLNAIQRMAESTGYQTVFIEAHEDKPLGALLVPYLRTLLFSLDRMAGIGNKAKRALSVLRSFVGALKISYGNISLGLDIVPELGSADSGDLEIDLPQLFVAVGEAAQDQGCAVAILVDEIQYLTKKELGALIMAMHKLQQRQLPMVLLGAGLPVLPGLAGESKSYAERLFSFPPIGELSREDAHRALRDPALLASVNYEKGALEKIFEYTKGYPYFLQEWGYKVWNRAATSPITEEDVERATVEAIDQLDQNFFRVRFDRLTPKEREFLRMMATLGKGTYKVSDVAGKFGTRVSGLSPVRASLMKKGMIYSPSYGYIAFTVPLFDEFMVRVIPEFP